MLLRLGDRGVIFCVHPDYRGSNKIGSEKGDHASERRVTRPEHRGQGDIDHRPDEGEEGHDGCHQRVFKNDQEARRVLRTAISDQEDRVPEALRHKDGNETRDREAEEDLLPDHLPFHEESAGDPVPSFAGQQFVAERTLHGLVPVHTFVGLGLLRMLFCAYSGVIRPPVPIVSGHLYR